ncbi:MAG TPA: MFS transporter [Pirellulales bacterium]|nr:MFS transporter [Pirellulales bacterium]
MNSLPGGARRLSGTQWLIVSLAALGFAFDIYELLMAQFIIRPAIMDLTGAKPGTPEFAMWAGRLFYVPAFVGGLFGLLGGYMTDRLGRRRVLTASILLYAFSAFAAGYSSSMEMLLVLRCTTFIGVCVEFVAAVAWLAELFTDPRQRENVLGYTQAFSSFGGLLVALAYTVATRYAESLPAIALPDWASFLGGAISDGHAPWRYTLMSGLVPAIPLILIRPFLPESPIWAAKRAAGTLRRPSLRELFAPDLRQTTIVTTLMFACSYGAAFGAIQQLPQIVPGVPEVKAEIAGKPVPAQKKIEQSTAAHVGTGQEIGGLVGRFLLAVLAVRIVSRRTLLRVFQIPGLIIVPLVFAFAPMHSLNALMAGAFLAGLFTVAQFSFWGNYLPRVYPVHLRGTGEGFAANIGGRMLGTSFAWVTNTFAVSEFAKGSSPPMKMAYTAAGVALTVYLVGTILSFWLPEPGAEMLPD